MSSIPSSDRQEIVLLCELHSQTHGHERGNRCIVFKSYFVKYGSHRTLRLECETQKYIYGLASNDSSAPRVARIVDYFFLEQRRAYLVMELIDSTTSADSEDAYEKIADALQWLRRVPVPQGTVIGPVGGGLAHHRIFKDGKASLAFSSTQALQNYMNKALQWIPKHSRPPPMDFSEDALVFTQSEMDASNFFLDSSGRICMLDFEAIGVLPESFASSTMHMNSGRPFVHNVARYLDWPEPPHLQSMAQAAYILAMIADPTLGLDDDGNPNPHKK
ncbi:hypothetical protein DENSPDRAFT_657798 [Dentipellis sp. KUC8613]|nr:hypothetical protein DENSPDRAFT_657798 [Dentipellis sp. KUC8613]